MTAPAVPASTCSTRTARRWLLGLEPFFEGGWFHKGHRARAWDVEHQLVGVSLLGDVTIDLCEVKSLPPAVDIEAYALGRDVDVIVPAGIRVELTGRTGNDHLRNGHLNDDLVRGPGESGPVVVRITPHTFLGGVHVRSAVGEP